VPLIDQTGSELPASIVQLTPSPAGRLSLTLMALAVPAPLLLKATTNPICAPAVTLAASAVLLIVTSAQLTVTAADSEPEPPLLVLKLAVLS
jgi:hypothetical protein